MRIALLMMMAMTNAACAGDLPRVDGVRVTGRLLSVNGTTDVPRGLFGVHATPLTAEQAADLGVELVRTISHAPGTPAGAGSSKWLPPAVDLIVECFYDRYQPALIVTDADWRTKLEHVAERYATTARGVDRPCIVEFWNEPYLNWGVRPGVNYDGRYYRDTGPAIGAPMTLRYADQPTEHLVWTKQLGAAPEAGGPVDYLATRYAPTGAKAGDRFDWRGRGYQMQELWWGRDPTQTSFWPGRQNSLWYRQMLVPFARKLKAINPDVTLVAGWGFHIHQNGWAAWDEVHRPTIDDAIAWIDGYNEHHYGGDTRMVAGAYETVTAYTVGRYGKALRFYNTEAGGELDPEQPGEAKPGYNVLPPDQRERGAMTYMLRDVIHLIDVCPDKAVARAAHEANTPGHAAAFRLLRPLRGRLVEAASSSPTTWVVSALEANRLCVVLFNDTLAAVTEPMVVAAPRGTAFGGAVRRTVGADLAILETPLDATGDRFEADVTLPGRSAICYVFALSGRPARDAPVRLVQQHYCPDILASIDPGASVERTIELPSPALDVAGARPADPPIDAAALRFVQHGMGEGVAVELNGTPIRVRPAAGWVHDEPIDPSLLRRRNVIRITNHAERRVELNALSLRTVRAASDEP